MKTSGLGDRLFVGGNDISGDIGSLSSISGSRATLDFTAITQEAFERKHGLRDGSIEFTSYFNPSAGQAHPTLSAMPTSDIIVSYFRGTTVGNPAASLVAKQVGYDPTRGNDGALTLNTSAQANGYGLEWGRQLTAGLVTVTEAGSGTTLDLGAATEHGGQMYLHVTAFTGTDITFGVETSSDDGDSDPYAGLVGLEQTVTGGPGAWRTSTTADVERYARFYCYTIDGFSECTFAVMFKANTTEVAF